jgi:hypothetical protein
MMVAAGETWPYATGARCDGEMGIEMSGLTEASVKAMSESDLYAALSMIQEEIKEREEGGFAETVRECLAELDDDEARADIAEGGGAVRLTFPADHWDDGFFYDEHRGELALRDGSTVEVDFDGTVVHDALTELSQVRRREHGLDRYSVLVVDLVTGEVKHDVHA